MELYLAIILDLRKINNLLTITQLISSGDSKRQTWTLDINNKVS